MSASKTAENKESQPAPLKRQKLDSTSADGAQDTNDKDGIVWSSLFGKKLMDGRIELDVDEALKGKQVAIYFSASWCPPCRRFTPMLKEWYAGLEDKQTEVVFCSSDHDQAGFDDYYGKQPWKAVPFQDETVRQKLKETFQVKGIPFLVTLDRNGRTITTNGVKLLQSNPSNPVQLWEKPKPLWEELAEEVALDQEGQIHKLGELVKDKEVIGLYFSAHWCAPCRAFTPKLAEFYKQLKEEGKQFEVIFCSSDRDEGAWKDYFSAMPWKAFPLSNTVLKDKLAERFKVAGIPALVLIDPQGNTVTTKGNLYINEPEEFPWTGPAKPLQRINGFSLGAINESPVFLAIVSNEAEEQEVRAWLGPLAQEYSSKLGEESQEAVGSGDQPKPKLKFLYGGAHSLVAQIKGFLKVEKTPFMLITDLQNGVKWLPASPSELNPESARQFLEAYLSPDKPGLEKKMPKQ
eukprot:gb/GEZN01004249.1/.p1 GENE.gb/GEZN01004249.1/~~gb/GEZN01004249.1/.p1  ORF type:complete len:462 (+),score=92.03 gb/GEZN01004249.1/:302-1687(+)